MIIAPAYGRDYKSAKAAIKDFEDNKDFIIKSLNHSGQYCSIRDFELGEFIEIRYNKLRSVYLYTVK